MAIHFQLGESAQIESNTSSAIMSSSPAASGCSRTSRLTRAAGLLAVGALCGMVLGRLLAKRGGRCRRASVSPQSDDSSATAIPTPTPATASASAPIFKAKSALPDGVSIRRATRADAPALYGLIRTVAAKRGGLARESDEVDFVYTDGLLDSVNGGLILVAEFVFSSAALTAPAPPQLIGVLKTSRLGPHRCFRGVLGDTTIAIHPEWQNRKIGQHLFDRFFTILTSKEFSHVRRVELIGRESNRHAIEMYRKVGFQIQTRLHSRIVSGMPLKTDNTDFTLQFESDIMMCWFNPAFDMDALKQQFVNTAV